MSTRMYPRWVKGNPPIRIFLPDYWMVLMKPVHPAPANEVHFMCPLTMTKWDIRNYLEQIYKVPVAGIKTVAKTGKIYKHQAEPLLVKDEDWRLAIVNLPMGQKFVFPNLFESTRMDEEMKDYKIIQQKMKRKVAEEAMKAPDSYRESVPSWFSI